jgi:hypothetical protein
LSSGPTVEDPPVQELVDPAVLQLSRQFGTCQAVDVADRVRTGHDVQRKLAERMRWRT